MLRNYNIFFNKGDILTSEMLKRLESYPKDLIKIYYSDYSEGIISGFKFFFDNEELSISSGILKFEKKLFILSAPENLTNKMTSLVEGGLYYICAVKSTRKSFDGISDEILDIQFLTEKKGFYFATLRYRENRKINLKYRKVSDFKDQNYLNILFFNFANIDEPTFSPSLLSVFANELSMKDNLPSICINLISKVFNNEKISLKYLRFFIDTIAKSQQEGLSSDNKQIFSSLEKILTMTFKVTKWSTTDTNYIEGQKTKDELGWPQEIY